MMPHLDEGMIHELLDGEIPSSDLPPITAHLATCADCRARLERAQALMAEADELIETLDLPAAQSAAEVTPLPVRRRPRWVVPMAWAASLALATALGYAARQSAPLLPPPAPTVNQPIGASDVTIAPSPVERSKESVLPPPPVMQRNEPAAKAAAPPLADSRQNAIEQPTSSEFGGTRDGVVATQPAPAPVVAAAPPAAGSASGATREALSGISSRRSDGERRSLARDQATSKQLIDGFAANGSRLRTDTIQLPDAMRLLGGRIRLIDGAVPKLLEAQGTEVRVIYPLATGDLVLSQRLVDGSISWRLLAPRGLAMDSVEKLRALVRE